MNSTQKQNSFVFFILLMFFSAIALYSTMFFKKLMLNDITGFQYFGFSHQLEKSFNTSTAHYYGATSAINSKNLLATNMSPYTFLNKIADYNLPIKTDPTTATLATKTTIAPTRNFLNCNITTNKQRPINFTALAPTSTSATTETITTREILTDTPLYKTTTDDPNETNNYYFLLPATYYAQIIRTVTLDSGAQGYAVKYNDFLGYATASDFATETSSTTTTLTNITIKMYPDAGTHIRSTPEILSNNKIKIIPSSTDGIIFLGYIYGDTPSDGTSNLWYFVEYNSGDTTAHLGYIYSERCILSSPITKLQKPTPITPIPDTQPTTDQSATADTNATSTTPTLNLSVSPTLKWIIAVLFIVPAVVIFVLLIKKPRRTVDEIATVTDPDFMFDTYPQNEDLIPEFSDIDTKKTRKNAKKTPKNLKFSSKFAPFVKFNTTLETSNELTADTSSKINPNPQTQNYNSPQGLNAINNSNAYQPHNTNYNFSNPQKLNQTNNLSEFQNASPNTPSNKNFSQNNYDYNSNGSFNSQGTLSQTNNIFNSQNSLPKDLYNPNSFKKNKFQNSAYGFSNAPTSTNNEKFKTDPQNNGNVTNSTSGLLSPSITDPDYFIKKNRSNNSSLDSPLRLENSYPPDNESSVINSTNVSPDSTSPNSFHPNQNSDFSATTNKLGDNQQNNSTNFEYNSADNHSADLSSTLNNNDFSFVKDFNTSNTKNDDFSLNNGFDTTATKDNTFSYINDFNTSNTKNDDFSLNKEFDITATKDENGLNETQKQIYEKVSFPHPLGTNHFEFDEDFDISTTFSTALGDTPIEPNYGTKPFLTPRYKYDKHRASHTPSKSRNFNHR